MRNPTIAPNYSFLLRLWQAGQSDSWRWHASLEPVGMGPRVGFADVEDLFAYLTDHIKNQENPPSLAIHKSESETRDTYQPVQGQPGDPWAVSNGAYGAEATLPYEFLSTREEEILRLIGDGRTNKQIAQQLSLSVRTIERYRSSIMRKAGLQSRAELVAYAVMQRILGGTQGTSN